MTTTLLTAVIHKEEKWYVAECPEVGAVSQGESIEEAVKNLKEATELYLEEFPQSTIDHPFLTTFEVSYAWSAGCIGRGSDSRPGTLGI